MLVTPMAGLLAYGLWFRGKRRTLALGVYPELSLSQARARREEARRSLAEDIDPVFGEEGEEASPRLPAKTRSRPLRESGSPTSGTGWQPVTAPLLLARLEADIFPQSDLAPLLTNDAPDC